MHDNRGIALIFNHEVFTNQKNRTGTRKDGDDLKAVLQTLQFDVKDYMDLKLDDIKKVLDEGQTLLINFQIYVDCFWILVSKYDHKNNDCLWVTVMSHGGENGEISAADKYYNVKELWENFLGENCKTLIGKPKLFFIQACRGDKINTGVSLELNDEVDSKTVHVIPQLADLLVMYSTAEGHYSFRNPNEGSWFIQALCKELKTNLQGIDDLIQTLTKVNRRVAFDKKSSTSNTKLNDGKQMPNIVSTLTKSTFFFNKSIIPVKIVSRDEELKKKHCSKLIEHFCYDMSNANRGIALIFDKEFNNDYNFKLNMNTKGFKSVLEKLYFDVRYYKDLKADEIRNVLYDGKTLQNSIRTCF